MNDAELIEKYGSKRESIKDLEDALNLLRIYGGDCELCIHQSIRKEAYAEFTRLLNELKAGEYPCR